MTLIEYLSRRWSASDLFNQGEFNEITRWLYMIIRRAVRDG